VVLTSRGGPPSARQDIGWEGHPAFAYKNLENHPTGGCIIDRSIKNFENTQRRVKIKDGFPIRKRQI